jgi:hypothetical protein
MSQNTRRTRRVKQQGEQTTPSPSDNGEVSESEKPVNTDFNPAAPEESTPAGRGANPAPDPYDPALLGLSQDYGEAAVVAPKIEIIKVEKPSKSRVFRVHPTLRLKTILLTIKDDNATYLVAPKMRKALSGNSLCSVYTLFCCVSKAGTPFIWAIKMADPDGKWNAWHQSAYGIAENAQARWCRMESNLDAKLYVATYDERPLDKQQEPNWPDLSLRDWLELAFRNYTIDDPDHPVLKRLRMED